MKRLLIVDDNGAFLSGMQSFLQIAGIEADVAETAGEARALLKVHRYEAALIDISLNGSTGNEGFSLLHEIRSAGRAGYVALMTAYGREETEEQVLAAGADRFLEKPVYPKTVLELLEYVRTRPA